MTIEAAFTALQQAVDADKKVVDTARARRNAFRGAFDNETDVQRTFASGSFARGSQIEPIKDVDLLVLYDETEHPDWGTPGESAKNALEHLRDRVKALLFPDTIDPGSGIDPVRLTKVRDHAVTCWLDDPDAENAFTVDVVPVLNRTIGGIPAGFFVPEISSEDWIASDPLDLVAKVLSRHKGSEGQFVKRLRLLKRFSLDRDRLMKGLTMEVLGLTHMPDGPAHNSLATFFAAAEEHVWQPICDPARLCGEIEPDLDRQAASDAFGEAAKTGWRANVALERGQVEKAICLWREIFDTIPEPEGGCKLHLVAGAAGAAGGLTAGGSPRRVRDLQQG